MTGSLAVVMAAIVPLQELPQSDGDAVKRVLRHSRFAVTETVRRIEVAARDRGLSVLVWAPGERSVLVLASTVGGTPVRMDDVDSQLAAPLSLIVREDRRGGADVLLASAADSDAWVVWDGLPAAVADDLAALPELVDRALG